MVTAPAQAEWLALAKAIAPLITAGVALWQGWQAAQQAQQQAAAAREAYYAQERLAREQLAASQRLQAYVCYGIFGAGVVALVISLRR